ncbi:MAG: NAD(P)-dependent oxidoreductase [Bacteroidetes bacterium]|nr:NAD(P)-dependent oxidoreductase [Bacteroidota bacterium]
MILVTGNIGFIGSYLTEKLIDKKYEVKGLDIAKSDSHNKILNQYYGSILDEAVVRDAMDGVDTVIHLAAEHKDFGVLEDDYMNVNVGGTKVLLKVASDYDVKKFIFFSSVAVYGDASDTTESTVPNPSNTYGKSKLLAEQMIINWVQSNNKRTAIIIRPTVVFGPKSKANIFRLIKQVCDGKFVMIGNGSNRKSIAYVRNLIDATLFLLERCERGLHIFNYSDEPHYTTRELVNMIARLANKKEHKYYIPLPLAISCGIVFDIMGKLTGIDFSITAARMKKFTKPTCHYANKIREFGFVPGYSIEEGLREHIVWYCNLPKQ